MEIFEQWPLWVWLLALAFAIAAAVIHGAIGFGFPLLSTPLVALITDVRTALLATLLPNIVLNIISVVRGPNWLGTLRKYLPLAAYVFLGTIAGTHTLGVADPRLLRLLLASIIVVYLVQARLRGAGIDALHRYPRVAPVGFGLVAGFFAGTVNVAVPPLLIYFSAMSLPPIVLTQALNLSFLVARGTQAVALAASGSIGLALALISIPVSIVCVLALGVGHRLQRHIGEQTFAQILRLILWAMASLLLFQAARGYFR